MELNNYTRLFDIAIIRAKYSRRERNQRGEKNLET